MEGCNWRIRTAAGEIGVKGIAGLIGGKDIPGTAGGEEIRAALPAEMIDFVVRKKDGYPAYQLTSVIDDLHYGIDLIVRGEDLWDSTLAQQFLAKELGRRAFGEIRFYHHPLLMEGGADAPMRTEDAPMRVGGDQMRPAAKLSKSAGATSVRHLREQGARPADIYPMIVRMLGMNFTAGSWEELAEGIRGNGR
jgi:glutamyl-tRNA synthetase